MTTQISLSKDYAFILIIYFFPCCSILNAADFDKVWTHKELKNGSDLVVIAKPKSQSVNDDVIDLKQSEKLDITLEGIDTTFEILETIKGEAVNEVVFKGYRVKKNNEVFSHGLLKLAAFRVDKIRININGRDVFLEKPSYLLYLTKSNSERKKYEPLSGIYKSKYSVFELSPSWSSEYMPVKK